jgi:integral membrane sensor domain MASE1
MLKPRGIDRGSQMKLIAVYVVFVLIGLAVAYGLGRTVEHWSPTASLPVFLAAFFFVFWAAWRLATRVA